MNKSYWIVPLVGLLIFAVVNSQFRKEYDAREQQAKVVAEQARQAELEAQRTARELAMQQALAAQERRRIEREEREAEKQREQEERRELISKRDEAFREQERYAREAKTVQEQIGEAKEALAEVERRRDSLKAEVTDNEKLAEAAEANTAALLATLDQIEADAAALQAARDTALAAAKKQ